MEQQELHEDTKSDRIKKAKLDLPKIKDAKPKDEFTKKWEAQAAMLPIGIRNKLELGVILHSEDQEEHPVTFKVIGSPQNFEQRIPRDESVVMKLPIYLMAISKRKYRRMHKVENGKEVAYNKLVPIHRIEVVDRNDVKKAIDKYIKEVG